MLQDRIAAFLHYGFLPDADEAFAEAPWCRPRDERPLGACSVEAAADAFRSACRALLDPVPAGGHVVPLSGGLDSRLILAVLIELGLRDAITAVTFGTRGTLDYELGRDVARAAGVRHEAIALDALEVEPRQLEETLATGGRWVPVFEALYNRLVPARLGADCAYWSGLMANTLNGSQCPERDESWAAACARFAREKRFARSVVLTPEGFRPEAVLPPAPLAPDSRLTAYEQLYTALVYPRRYEPTVLAPGVDYRLPFRDRAWTDFALALPRRHRVDQRLYREMLPTVSPELFTLPSKTSHGVAIDASPWVRRTASLRLKLGNRIRRHLPGLGLPPNPLANYVDFDHALRLRGPLAGAALPLIEKLAARKVVPWLDPTALWEEHRRGRHNHGDALVALVSLEMNLAFEESLPR